MSSALSVLASTQNQFNSNSGGMPLAPNFPVVTNSVLTGLAVTATTATIPLSYNGSVVAVAPNATNPIAIITATLPSPVLYPGWNCKFVMTGNNPGANDNQVIRFDCGATLCCGSAFNTGVAPAMTQAGQYAQFIRAARTGDMIQVQSDGVRYICQLYSSNGAGVSIA